MKFVKYIVIPILNPMLSQTNKEKITDTSMIYEIHQDHNFVFHNIGHAEHSKHVEMLIWLSLFFNIKYLFENINEIKCYHL